MRHFLTSNSDGAYAAPSLLVDACSVKVTLERLQVLRSALASCSKSIKKAQVDTTLEVNAVTEVVEVTPERGPD